MKSTLRLLLMTTALTRPAVYDGEKIRINYDDEADVPAAFKTLYTEKDGKWLLTGVDGMKTQDDISKVAEALRKERNDHRTLKESFRKVFGENYDLQAISDSAARVTELEAELAAAGDPKNQKKIDDLVNAKVKTLTASVERERDQLKTKNSELETNILGFTTEKKTRTIHDAIREAGVKQKVLPEALDDALMLAERNFEISEDGTVVTKDMNGASGGLNAADWFTDMQAKKPHWWGTSAGGGAGGSRLLQNGEANPFTHENWNMTKQGALHTANPARAAALASAAGTTVGGQKPLPKK